MKRVLQPSPSGAQPPHGYAHIPDRPREGWRTVRELTEELRFPSSKACRAWLSRERIPSVRRGRVILVSTVDVQRKLRGVA